MQGRQELFFRGYIRVEINSPLPERFLNLCAFHRIALWDLENRADRYSFCMYARDLERLRPVCRKSNTKLTVKGHYGMPFFLKKYRKRKMFAVSFLLCACMVYVLTLFVWRIDVTGLSVHREEEIIACLADLDVRYGMRRSGVDCQEIEACLRNAFDDFVWVAASVEGTQLRIQVKENTDNYEAEESAGAPADLAADTAGKIVEMVTQRGTPQVAVGDTVEEGQILISGREAYLDDAGTVLRYEEMEAQGEVLVETTLTYEDRFSYTYKQQVKTGRKRYGLALWVFGKQIFSFSGSNAFQEKQTSGEKKTIVLGEHFYLPLAYRLTTIAEVETTEREMTKKEAEALARKRFASYAGDLAKKGVEIIENRVKIVLEEDGCHTGGTLRAVVPTGTLQPLAPPDTEAPAENAEETQ